MNFDQFEFDPVGPFEFVPPDAVFRLLDAFDFRSAMDTTAFSFSRDAQVIANTRLNREAHFFTADVTGLKKEEEKIELVDNGSWRISGERHKKDAQETAQWHRVERSSGEFGRQLPLKKEKVKIELVDDGLRISGERHKEDFQEAGQWHRVERSSGIFGRQVRVPENVNAGDISAKLENGGLTVKDPKIKPGAASGSDVKSKVQVPENVNADGISAKVENGGLTVKDPKVKPGAASGSDVKSIDIPARLKKKEVAPGGAVKRDIQETVPAAGKGKCKSKPPRLSQTPLPGAMPKVLIFLQG